jgi:hypothetical protein
MKHLLGDYISSTVQQPFVQDSIQLLDANFTEVVNSLSLGLANISHPLIVHGCVWTYSGGVLSITAGAVFYNGELYQCDAFTATESMPSNIYGNITTVYGANDPILFTDGLPYNVHQTKKIVWGGSSSSIDLLQLDWYRLNNGWNTYAVQSSDITLDSGTVSVGSYGSYIKWKNDIATKTLTLDIHLIQLETSATSTAGLRVDFNNIVTGGANGSNGEFVSMGMYLNSADATKNKMCQMVTTNVLTTVEFIPIDFTTFDLTGTNNVSFRGQIVLNTF